MAKFLIVHHINSYFSKLVDAATPEEAEKLALDQECVAVKVPGSWRQDKAEDTFIATEVESW